MADRPPRERASTNTSLGGAGAFLQFIPGVTDEVGWPDAVAAPPAATCRS